MKRVLVCLGRGSTNSALVIRKNEYSRILLMSKNDIGSALHANHDTNARQHVNISRSE